MEKSQLLPNKLDVLKLAPKRVSIKGKLPISSFTGIDHVEYRQSDFAYASFSFKIDDKHRLLIIGCLQASLNLICQRCMKPFSYTINSDFQLSGIEKYEELSNIPAEYDPVFLKNGMLEVVSLLREEIIINIPIVPCHELDKCKGMQSYKTVKQIPGTEGTYKYQSNTHNPFAVLSVLKKK